MRHTVLFRPIVHHVTRYLTCSRDTLALFMTSCYLLQPENWFFQSNEIYEMGCVSDSAVQGIFFTS